MLSPASLTESPSSVIVCDFVMEIPGTATIPSTVGSSNNSPSALIPSSLMSLTYEPLGVTAVTEPG